MMKHILRFAFLGLVLGVASCSKVEDVSSEKGYGVLSIDMSLADLTRAVTEDDLRNSASVKIYKADFSGLVRSYTYSDMPEAISLVADQYRVDVEAGETVKDQPVMASWDSKSYKGSKEFTIVAGKTETVQVEAKVCNAMTMVSFDSSVAENFNAGYTLTVNVDGDQSRQLVYNASKSGQEGYFVIDGDSYYLTLGAMEVYCDGKLRYEVNNDRKEVVEDRANLEEGDILTNPTRAFDFVSDVYNLAIDSVTANGATIRITPKSDVAEVTIYIDVVKRGSKVLPERVLYDYDGEGYTIELGIIEGTPDATPKWNKANYRGYDIVSFL